MTLKLVSGADVTVLPPSTYSKLTYKPLLSKTEKKLYGPWRYDLRCRGEFQAMLKYGPKTWKTTSYALDDLSGPLLGRIACQKLRVLAKVSGLASPERTPGHMKRTHPKVTRKELNKAVLRENHPMPTTEQTLTLAKLAGAKIVSKLDANCRFWLRKLTLNSKLLTTFITPWGRYCYRRLPFVISSPPEHSLKIMQKILAGLEGVECQMDDILVFGDSMTSD